jgi:hypothetical protein
VFTKSPKTTKTPVTKLPCLHPHPVLIGVCLDIDIGIGK